jgi:hypothetical protein
MAWDDARCSEGGNFGRRPGVMVAGPQKFLRGHHVQLHHFITSQRRSPSPSSRRFDCRNTITAAMKCLAVSTLIALSSLQQSVESFAFSTRSAVPRSFQRSASRTSLNSVASDMETLLVTPIKSLDGTVTLPGSKSLSNRCLLLAALSEGTTRVDNLLESDDIRYMLEALDKLGVPVERVDETSVIVTGQGGPINAPSEEICELFLGNAGTAMRPLAAALCMGKGDFVLDGVPRMRERPIADLVDGLQQLGADVTCVEETGCPPVTIKANGLSGGKVCFSDANIDDAVNVASLLF